MSNIDSKNKWQVCLMRWAARLISIPWAYCALGFLWFIAGNGYEEGMSLGLYITMVFIAFLLSLGATIIAGVWGLEALGGTVLLADCVLIFLWFAASPYAPRQPLLVLILLLPPLLAGCLFRTCHRKAKTSAKQQV